MAKQVGLLIKGRIDSYSFYHNRLHGYLVRRTGGVTSKKYLTDSRYEAARAASSEFTYTSGVGKLIREALNPFCSQVKDGSMVNRLNKELIALKQLDNKNTMGERKPETMMTDTKENKWLRIFQFNQAVKTYELTGRFPVLTKANSKLIMNHMELIRTAFPKDATHAGLTLIRTVIDFEKKVFNTSSSGMTLVSKDKEEDIKLEITGLPALSGTEITCLQIVFFREQNDAFIQLKTNVHSMGILAINENKDKIVPLGIRRNQPKTWRPDTIENNLKTSIAKNKRETYKVCIQNKLPIAVEDS